LAEFGIGCRLRTAHSGNSSKILCATAMLARSMNSSTSELVSRDCLASTSIGSRVSVSILNRISNEASDKAPLPLRRVFSFLAMRFRCLVMRANKKLSINNYLILYLPLALFVPYNLPFIFYYLSLSSFLSSIHSLLLLFVYFFPSFFLSFVNSFLLPYFLSLFLSLLPTFFLT